MFFFRSPSDVENTIGISVELSHLKVLAFLPPFSSLQLQHMNLSLVLQLTILHMLALPLKESQLWVEFLKLQIKTTKYLLMGLFLSLNVFLKFFVRLDQVLIIQIFRFRLPQNKVLLTRHLVELRPQTFQLILKLNINPHSVYTIKFLSFESK